MTEGDARNEVAGPAGGRLRGGRPAPPRDRVPRARARRIPARRSAAHDAGGLLSRRGGLGAAGARAGRRLRSQRRRRADARARVRGRGDLRGASACSNARSPCWRRPCVSCRRTRRCGLALADGLARCGRHDEARAQLSRLVEQAGWRRTRKRAHAAPAAGRDRPRAGRRQARARRVRAGVVDGRLEPRDPHPAGRGGRGDGRSGTRRARLPDAAGADPRGRGASPGRAGRPGADGDPAAALRPGAQARARRPRPTSCSTRRWPPPSRIPEQASRLQRGLLQTGAHDELARLFEKRLARAAGTPAEAEISAEMAESLRAQGKPEAAFDAQLRAVESAPETRGAARAARRDGARLRAGCSSSSNGCSRSSSGAAARPTWASPHAAAAGGGRRRARLRRSGRAPWICTAAPRRCSPVRSRCSRGSRGSRSNRGTSPNAIASPACSS